MGKILPANQLTNPNRNDETDQQVRTGQTQNEEVRWFLPERRVGHERRDSEQIPGDRYQAQ